MSMKNRKDAFEKKFTQDAELKFKAEARRNKLVALWAADKLGKSATDAEAYVKQVIAADFEEAGDEDVYRKLRSDLPASIEDMEIREKLIAFMEQAIADLGK